VTDILDVLRQHGVSYATEGDSKVSKGWAGMHCPFCTGSSGFHLGFDLAKKYFTCWRCGHHSGVEVLQALCHVDLGTAIGLWQGIRDAPSSGLRHRQDAEAQSRISLSSYRRPSDVGAMGANHRHYLEGRGFDPDEIEREWCVMGTGPVAYLDDIDYRHRLFAPIYWEDREVSFQTRDVTGRSDVKYRACPMSREARHHKYVVYQHRGYSGELGIAVEGITDCWRLGRAAFAVFGIQYRTEQVQVIRRRYRHVAVVFDPERKAQQMAGRLVMQLRYAGLEAQAFDVAGASDPGSMGRDDAAHLVREIRRWGRM